MIEGLYKLPLAAAFVLAVAAVSPDSGETGELPSSGHETREPVEAGSTLERGRLVAAVLERNRTLEEARQASIVVEEQVLQAARREDLRVSYDLAPLSVATSDSRYGQVLRVGWRLPYPGKYRHATAGAAEAAEASGWAFEAVRLELATLASQLFDEYYFVHRALEINDEHIALLRDFQRIALAQYRAGTAAQQDPIQAEVWVARLLHRDVVLETKRANLRSQINTLQHRPPEAQLLPPPSILPPPPSGDIDAGGAQRAALSERPEIAAAEAEIRSREAELGLRGLDSRPDFEVMSSFNSMWGESDHRWTIGAGIAIPLGRQRIRSGVAESEARLAEAMAGREALVDSIRSQVQQAYDRLEESRHVLDLYDSRLLPASRDQIDAALSGFKTSRNSFLALIEAERNQRTVHLEYERALADAWQRRADLDRRMGRFPVVAHPLSEGGEDDVTNAVAQRGGSR